MALTAELCTDCAICCDGTLFSSVALEAPGVAAARQQHLPIVDTADGSKLELPCAALKGVLCGIYAQRPTCCADYACALLVRVDERSLSIEAAREIIETTRATRARVQAAAGNRPWWVVHRSVMEAARTNADWASDNAEMVSAVESLKMLVWQHFLG